MEEMSKEQLMQKYRALSEAIARALHDHGVTHYLIVYQTAEGQAVTGLNGHPFILFRFAQLVLTLLHLEMGTDVYAAMSEMIGVERGPQEVLFERTLDDIKKKMN